MDRYYEKLHRGEFVYNIYAKAKFAPPHAMEMLEGEDI
jgi:hypothetical protein